MIIFHKRGPDPSRTENTKVLYSRILGLATIKTSYNISVK